LRPGTPLPAKVNGTYVFTTTGQPLRDKNGDPIVIPPVNAPLPPQPRVGRDAFPRNYTLPDGSRAMNLRAPVCRPPTANSTGSAVCR
jgi:hypothetical protein